MTHYRNSGRCTVDSTAYAGRLFAQLQAHLPEKWHGWKLAGINERFKLFFSLGSLIIFTNFNF